MPPDAPRQSSAAERPLAPRPKDAAEVRRRLDGGEYDSPAPLWAGVADERTRPGFEAGTLSADWLTAEELRAADAGYHAERLAALQAEEGAADAADRCGGPAAAEEPGEAEPAPTWRTLADIPDDPPRQLLLGMLEPDGPTLAYAAPGVGKGTTGAWVCVEAEHLGLRPLVYDPEGRPREWSRRVAGLGGDRSRVVYLTPPDLGRRYAGRPLWEAAPALGSVIRAAGVDLLLVDSIVPATGLGEERLRSDAQVPYLYVSALDALGIPSLSFGHPPKGQPEGDPFGSFAWLAAMRFTWLGTRAEGEGHRIRWRPRKRNERGYVAGVLLTFAYGDDGRPCSVAREDDEESTREWLLLALVRGPRSVSDLSDELAEETEEHITAEARDRIKERLSRTLRRMAQDGAVIREGPPGGRGVKWSLRWEPGR